MVEKKLIELLTKKLTGEASAAELIELKTLLSEYPDALDTEEIFSQIWEAPVEEEEATPYYERHKKKYATSLNTLHHADPFPRRKPEPRRYRYAIAACYVLILLTASLLFFFKKNEVGPSGYTQIVAGKGIRRLVTLPDGTRVWLNSDSRLSYDPRMKTGNSRQVTLTGEAFFDVAPDKQHPFLVHTGRITVKVLGTAFDVMAYPNAKKCATTLISGSLELSVNDDPNQKFILKPSEKFTLAGAQTGSDSRPGTMLLIEPVTRVKIADDEYVSETSWKEDRLVFANETLDEIAGTLERWFNKKITISGDTIGQYRFTGVFGMETVEQTLDAMQSVRPFHTRTSDDTITLY